MTASQTAPFGFPQNLISLMRRIGALLSKSAVGIVIVLMAGIIAVATAAAGIALAVAAVLLGLFAQRRTEPVVPDQNPPDSMTLDARKTPRGWTVE